jgi:hypothetical protein
MPLSIIIDAPVSDVYNVLNDPTENDKWNPVTDKVIPDEQNPNECNVESFMGKFRTKKDAVQDQRITLTITGNPVLSELKYELVALSTNQTRVDGTIQLAGPAHYTTIHRTVGEKLLQNLKRYVEHLQSGGTDANFRKEQ